MARARAQAGLEVVTALRQNLWEYLPGYLNKRFE
jgi:hypothetical protein